MSIQPVGFTLSTKTPGQYFAVVLGGGAASPANQPTKILLFGNQIETTITGSLPTLSISAGIATAAQVVQVFSADQAADLFGRGSELHLGVRALLRIYRNATLYVIPVAQAGGAAASSVVLTPTIGTITASVTVRVWIGGRMSECVVGTSDTVVTIGSAIATAINSQTEDCPAYAQYNNSTGVVTITAKTLGTRGNWIPIRVQLLSGTSSVKLIGGNLAGTVAGVTLTLSGGSAVGNAYRLAGGSGTDNLTNALAAVAGVRYDRYVLASVDGTNIDRVVTQLNTMAGISTGKRQQAVCATPDTYANAVTLATGRNAPRLQMGWHYNSDASPLEMAAALCAVRLVGDGAAGGAVIGETVDPSANLNGASLAPIVPVQDADGDRPTSTQVENALNNGLTVLAPSSLTPAYAQLVASLTTRSLDGASQQNYSVWKTKQVTVPDFTADTIASDLAVTYQNYKLEADSAQPIDKARVVRPAVVKGRIYEKLKDLEVGGIVTNVDGQLGSLDVQIDPTNNQRLLAEVPVTPTPDYDQTAGNIRQNAG